MISYIFFNYIFSFSSFQLFLHPLLGLLLSQLRQPLLYWELVLPDISACRTNFFILLVAVNNPFTQRKDSHSLSPINGALFNSRISVTYFEESGSHLIKNSHAKNSWRPVAGSWIQTRVPTENYITKQMLFL